MRINVNRLKEIAHLANKKAIIHALKAEGYSLAGKDKRYSELNLQTIFRAEACTSEWVQDALGSKEFKCSVYENVPGTEPGTSFAVLSVNDIDRKRQVSFPRDMMIFVKSN